MVMVWLDVMKAITVKRWLGAVILLMLIGLGMKSYCANNKRSGRELDDLASSVLAMNREIPGHFKLSSATVRVQHDSQVGCWIVLGYVFPKVELYYSDNDKLLYQKSLPLTELLVWLKKQRLKNIWLWDGRMPLADVGHFYKIIEVLDAALDKHELYFHVEGATCNYHEGQRVSVYGKMHSDEMHSLLLNDLSQSFNVTSDHSPK